MRTKSFNVNGFTLEVVPWAVESGVYDEDGRHLINERLHVVIQNKAGRRWAHKAAFGTHIDYDLEYGGTRVVGYKEAKKAAFKLYGKVAHHLYSGGNLNESQWVEIDPAYGSKAWQASDCEQQQIRREREQG